MNIKEVGNDWQEYLKVIRTFELNAQAFKASACRPTSSNIDFKLSLERNSIESCAHSIRLVLARHAESCFSPSTITKIEIDYSELYERFPINFNNTYPAEQFEPVAVWDYLVKTYQGDAGQYNALGVIANILIAAFGLRRSSEIKMISGRYILGHSIDIDEYHKKYDNENRLTSASTSTLEKIVKALQSYFQWAGDVDSQEALRDYFSQNLI